MSGIDPSLQRPITYRTYDSHDVFRSLSDVTPEQGDAARASLDQKRRNLLGDGILPPEVYKPRRLLVHRIMDTLGIAHM